MAGLTTDRLSDRARFVWDRHDVLTLGLLFAHGCYWTLMPALVTGSFSMDTGEALFWGREWQLGFYKHPPLSAWLAELSVASFGATRLAVYLVPQVCVLASFGATWWLARRLVSSGGAFLSVAALELFFAYTYESLQYNANVALLPFWAWTIGLAWSALEARRRLLPWLGLGAAVGLGLLAKYAILILCLAIALYCLATPSRRWAFRHWGPWLSLAVALLVASPHLYWLGTVDAHPLTYAAASKGIATFSETLPYAAIFLAYQILIYLPLCAVVATWAFTSRPWTGASRPRAADAGSSPLDRRQEAIRFLVFATFGPVAVTVVAAVALIQKTPPGWSHPFPIASGLLVVLTLPWLERDLTRNAVPRAARWLYGACVIALALVRPIHLAAWSWLGLAAPRLAFDGPAHGRILDDYWRARRDPPLLYQVSHFGPPEDRALGSTTAFFSRFRPSVFHAADPRRAPWVDVADYRAKGGVVVSLAPIDPAYPFAGLCAQAVERFERPTLYRGYRPQYFYLGLLLPAGARTSCP